MILNLKNLKMKNMSKVLVIGCGGIGSHLCREIDRLIQLGQLSAIVSIADFDTVDVKNIEYGQDFSEKDLMKNKAECLGKKYSFKAINKRINENDLSGYDLIVLAVDNNSTREMVMRYCHNNNKDYIDLRADGRMIFAKPKGKSLEEDLKTLDLQDRESGSCQTQQDIDKDWIQNGNIIIASIGSQMILNWERKEDNYKLILKI